MSFEPFNSSDVLFFFGAGASAPFGIPTMKQFVSDFETSLEVNATEEEKSLYGKIKATLEKQLGRSIDLEDIFTVIDGLMNFSIERLGTLPAYLLGKYVSPVGDL